MLCKSYFLSPMAHHADAFLQYTAGCHWSLIDFHHIVSLHCEANPSPSGTCFQYHTLQAWAATPNGLLSLNLMMQAQSPSPSWLDLEASRYSYAMFFLETYISALAKATWGINSRKWVTQLLHALQLMITCFHTFSATWWTCLIGKEPHYFLVATFPKWKEIWIHNDNYDIKDQTKYMLSSLITVDPLYIVWLLNS